MTTALEGTAESEIDRLKFALAAMTAQRDELERRSQEREAWLLGHISEEEHMRFVERFQ